MITLQEAKKRQNKLQAEAAELLNKHQVLDRLKSLGNVHIDGSYAYGLMVKPDIDIHITNTAPSLELATGVINDFLLKDHFVRVMIVDNKDNILEIPGLPRGIYIGLRTKYKTSLWNFDIWVIKPEDKKDEENFPLGWHKRLTEAQKDMILHLKANLMEQGRYPNEFLSADIYRAVMNDNVKTIDELVEWRKTHPYY